MINGLLIASVVAAALTVVWLKPTDQNRLKLLIAFSGSYLLSITALHLLPEVFIEENIEENRGPYFGAFILVGFFLQLMLEYFSGGIEHGHAHHQNKETIPIALLVGLCLHAFFEGIPLGGGDDGHAGHSHPHDHGHSHGHSHSHGTEAWQSGLLWGIVLHKYPVAIVFFSMLLNSGMGKTKALLLLAVFGAMAPLGALLGGAAFLENFEKQILAIVIGILLHVSTTILFESSEGHKFNAQKMLVIAAGLALAGFGMMLHPH